MYITKNIKVTIFMSFEIYVENNRTTCFMLSVLRTLQRVGPQIHLRVMNTEAANDGQK